MQRPKNSRQEYLHRMRVILYVTAISRNDPWEVTRVRSPVNYLVSSERRTAWSPALNERPAVSGTAASRFRDLSLEFLARQYNR